MTIMKEVKNAGWYNEELELKNPRLWIEEFELKNGKVILLEVAKGCKRNENKLYIKTYYTDENNDCHGLIKIDNLINQEMNFEYTEKGLLEVVNLIGTEKNEKIKYI